MKPAADGLSTIKKIRCEGKGSKEKEQPLSGKVGSRELCFHFFKVPLRTCSYADRRSSLRARVDGNG